MNESAPAPMPVTVAIAAAKFSNVAREHVVSLPGGIVGLDVTASFAQLRLEDSAAADYIAATLIASHPAVGHFCSGSILAVPPPAPAITPQPACAGGDELAPAPTWVVWVLALLAAIVTASEVLG